MNCCLTTKKNKDTTSKPVCPACQSELSTVDIKTVKHWLKASFIQEVPEESFYFCSVANCSVVYFSEKGTTYKKEDVRARIGVKEKNAPIPVCYCFGVTEDMIKKGLNGTGKNGFSKWISVEIKKGNCACDIRNPSGRCCLAAIKRIEKEQFEMAETNQLKPDIEKLKKTLIETISPKALPQKIVPLCVQIMRLLVKGRPVSPEQIASTGSFPFNEAATHLSDFQNMGMAELDDTGLIAMVLSLKPTEHHFRVNGKSLFTWCAIDTLFLPAVLNQSADVESTCPITNTKIHLTITPEGIEKVNPSDVFMSIVAPGVTKGITANCSSNGSCVPDNLTGSKGSFCSNVHFFSSYEAGSKWLANCEGGSILSIDEAYKLAYDIWARPFLESV